MKKFYPEQVAEKYPKTMIDYLIYLFPNKKFTLYELNMYRAMFMKGHDIGCIDAIYELYPKKS